MNDDLPVDFFVEDSAHERFFIPLAERIAEDEGMALRCRVRNARGDHAQAIDSFGRPWES